MGTGLQVFNPAGVKTFDSDEAYGGVCLGGFTIPGQAATYTLHFYAFTSGTPYVFNPLGGAECINNMYMSFDYAAGYLRVCFGPTEYNSTRFVSLFMV